VSGGSYANNPLALPGAAADTAAAIFIPATPLPAVTTHTGEVRLNGTYSVTNTQALRLLYSYLRMESADWMYEGMQMGAGTPGGVLPTLEQPFNYHVHILGMSYVVTF
jgi:hypothetical protein